jgi:hypothetical protein
MADPAPEPPEDPTALARKLERLEARLARVESYLRLDEPAAPADAAPVRTEEDLEFRVGQDWFGRAGIAALGLGFAFTLSLPYRGLPAALPALVGFAFSAGLFGVASRTGRSHGLISSHLRATAMALFYFSALRLCFFGSERVFAADSLPGAAVLALAAAANFVIALRRRSTWLFGLALVSGFATALAVGAPGFALALIGALPVVAVAASSRLERPEPTLMAMPLAYGAYSLWAVGDPFLGGPWQAVGAPGWAPLVLLIPLTAFAVGLRRWTLSDRVDALANAGSLLNAVVGYGLFLLHTFAAFDPGFVADQIAASSVLLILAVMLAREKSGVGPFVYAMTGFFALSCAIIRATGSPEVFVWLSVQSVIVVGTAIWLRSRFIVVANFLIYLGILASYVLVARGEKGISIGFGLVALVTARLLGWKQERLELKTELMRNAYLLYHLVPGAWVGLAWVGAALLYYLLGSVLGNRKYRWMGHATLLMTALYLAIVGIDRLEPVFRTLSFLVLGAVLLVVSLVFTRARASRQGRPQDPVRPG